MASRLAPTAMPKRTVVIGRLKTSVSMEDEFWDGVRQIADEKGMSMSAVVSEIAAHRTHPNLCSAIRLHVLAYYRDRARLRAGGAETQAPSLSSRFEPRPNAPSGARGGDRASSATSEAREHEHAERAACRVWRAVNRCRGGL